MSNDIDLDLCSCYPESPCACDATHTCPCNDARNVFLTFITSYDGAKLVCQHLNMDNSQMSRTGSFFGRVHQMTDVDNVFSALRANQRMVAQHGNTRYTLVYKYLTTGYKDYGDGDIFWCVSFRGTLYAKVQLV